MSVPIATQLRDLVAAAAGGDELAFTRLVELHDDDMVRVAYLVTSDTAIAREAAQAAWTIAWRKLPMIKDPHRVGPWLIAVTVNEARQLVRRQRRQAVREIPVATFEHRPEHAPSTRARDERWLDLREALQRLSEEDRTIVAMRYAVGLTSEEIGRAIGMSSPTVRSRLARALDRLRKELGDDPA